MFALSVPHIQLVLCQYFIKEICYGIGNIFWIMTPEKHLKALGILMNSYSFSSFPQYAQICQSDSVDFPQFGQVPSC